MSRILNWSTVATALVALVAQDSSAETAEPVAPSEPFAEVIEYEGAMALSIESTSVRVHFTSDFPESTIVHLVVNRPFWEEGSAQSSVGDIASKELPLVGGEIDVTIGLRDELWHVTREAQKERLKKLGVFDEIERIGDEVSFFAIVDPRRQNDELREIFGRSGEGLGGQHVVDSLYRLFVLHGALDIPFRSN